MRTGYQQWDASLFRNARIREWLRLQIRAETFNLFNRANFFTVGTALGDANFGQASSTRGPRRIQIGLKLIF
jgi:hypothetical protein